VAKFYADPATGEILGLALDAREERLHADKAGASVLEFDADTNAQLLAAFRSDWSSFRVSGGTLLRNGSPYPVASDSQERTDWRRLPGLLTLLNAKASALDASDVDQLSAFLDRLAPAAANLSAAEVKRMLRILFLVNRALLQLLKEKYS
jgi:hypothetical protein